MSNVLGGREVTIGAQSYSPPSVSHLMLHFGDPMSDGWFRGINNFHMYLYFHLAVQAGWPGLFRWDYPVKPGDHGPQCLHLSLFKGTGLIFTLAIRRRGGHGIGINRPGNQNDSQDEQQKSKGRCNDTGIKGLTTRLTKDCCSRLYSCIRRAACVAAKGVAVKGSAVKAATAWAVCEVWAARIAWAWAVWLTFTR